MSTRERVHAEIDKVADDRLDDLLHVIEDFHTPPTKAKKVGILRRLQQIKIDGPPDFSRNLDLYLSGEKKIEDYLP